ncbi:MAG: hypothetical protein Q4F18_09210 [Clostridia bacterium]|nr:hypothetical protein [Clostridia bacterium]
MKMNKLIVCMAALICLLLCGSAAAENQYYAVSAPVEIAGAQAYTLVLDAREGWQFNITDNMDVTSWLVKEDGSPAFADAEGIATTKLVYGKAEGEEEELAVACEVIIDASKITGFTANGSYDLYVLPTGKSTLWVYGDNKGQYQNSAEKAGAVLLPAVSVEGKLTGKAQGGSGLEAEQNTVEIVLALDGIDDSLIDGSGAVVTLLEGDGYKTYEVSFEAGELSSEWNGGRAVYTMGAIGGNFSPQGGDGNGHYDLRIGVSGLSYNGLPLTEAIIRTDFYSFGRTFSVDGGSLIRSSEPAWSADEEIPVLCDVYPDRFTAVWPVGFDASALTEADVSVKLISDYGDEIVLEAGKDFTVASGKDRSEVTVSYIYWAYAPVYTEMEVSVNTAALTWDEQMYAPGEAFTHSFDIATVYIYSVMSGGTTGTQCWTYFGLDNLTDSHQVYAMATYTLTAVDAEGNAFFYGEDESGNGIRVDAEADAVVYSADEECNVHLENDSVFYTRLFDQTEDKTVDGETITFTKNYANCESLPLPVDSLIDVTPARGYAIGSTWEDHLKWPWQSFIGVGYQGGSK